MDKQLHNLILAAQQGEPGAFNEIIKRFRGMAFASAYTMLGDGFLAEDVVQEAFIEAFTSLPKLRVIDAFPGWFRSIVFKQGDRVLRHRNATFVPLAAIEEAQNESCSQGSEGDPADIVVVREQDGLVQRAIALLPDHERVTILLFYSSGYAIKEIAAFLEVPLTTVKKRLHDARKRLKKHLMENVRETLQQQHILPADYFSAKIRMLVAARLGDIDGCKAMLAKDPTLVHARVKQGEQLKRPNPALSTGDTPLHEAAAHHHLELARLLLEYGAWTEARTSSGETPLHSAVAANDLPMVKLLLDAGADINASLANGHTPLRLAVIKGDTQMADLLLRRGASPHTLGENGLTPLHWAALKGYPEIVSMLLAKGADASARDHLGRTPLDWARYRAEQGMHHGDYTRVMRLLNDEH
jgi:RNA polymerase sigma factor (sigma-70 family)